jgi:hypothetical protein
VVVGVRGCVLASAVLGVSELQAPGGFSTCTRLVGSCSKNTHDTSRYLRVCLLYGDEWLPCSVIAVAFEALAYQ